MKPKIFIDGSEGTSGLNLHGRLAKRADIELMRIEKARIKDADERRKLINSADLVFLCIPDEAAQKTMALIENKNTRIIDASSAHRVADGWVYGLPELSKTQREDIKTAKRVSNPGCHATGAILLLAPIVEAGVLPAEYPISITSLTGYTGGGKGMILEYEGEGRNVRPELNSPRLYGMAAEHKHIPEIVRYSGLRAAPGFMPIVAGYPQGVQVAIALRLPGKRREAYDVLARHYGGCKNIEVARSAPAFAASNVNAGNDKVSLKVLGYGDMIVLTAQFDNLGKGASGQAVQNMNIMLGFDEYEGLII